MTKARRDTLLVAVVLLGLAAILSHAHAVRVDHPNEVRKLERHEATLRNGERDPYQYKLFTITWAVEAVHRATGAPIFGVYLVNGFLATFALLAAHFAWLARLYGRRSALLGTGLLAALCHGLFLGYHHHPYDLWGVAAFCLLLRAMAGGAPLARLCGIAFLTGLVWEKQALAAPVYGLLALRRKEPFVPSALRAGALLVCAIAIPVAIRLGLGTDREKVDVTPLSAQAWGQVLSHHGPFVLPFLAILVLAWDRVPRLVRTLWLTVPALFAAYLASRFLVDELRSFWAFVPTFTATACAWARDLPDVPTGPPSPDGLP